MRLRRYKHILALVVAVVAGVALSQTDAAQFYRQHIPIAQRAAQSEPILLVEGDHGFVSALNWRGRFFLVYQSRPDGHAHFVEHIGTNMITDVDSPAVRAALSQLLGAQPSPAFDLPGPKQGSASLVEDGTSIRIYYAGRAVDDPTGPFMIWWVRYTPEP